MLAAARPANKIRRQRWGEISKGRGMFVESWTSVKGFFPLFFRCCFNSTTVDKYLKYPSRALARLGLFLLVFQCDVCIYITQESLKLPANKYSLEEDWKLESCERLRQRTTNGKKLIWFFDSFFLIYPRFDVSTHSTNKFLTFDPFVPLDIRRAQAFV